MFKIVGAQFVAPGIKRFTTEAPRFARKHRPGMFFIVWIGEHGERIPPTMGRSDAERARSASRCNPSARLHTYSIALRLEMAS